MTLPISPLLLHSPYARRYMGRHFVLFALMLSGLSARAADYVFPGAFPPGCSGGNGVYACGVLTLASGDTITIGAPFPATITFSGALTANAGSSINSGGLADNLSLVMRGVLTLGASVIANANVAGTAAINLGAGSTFGGTISASTPTGVITLGANSKVSGGVSSDDGAINTGAGAAVSGNLTSQAGKISVGADAKISGTISSGDGGIDIGNGTIVGGSIGAAGAGVISLSTNVKVGGSVSSNAGALTAGDGSTVAGNLTVSGAGAVTLTGALVGGDVRGAGGAISLTGSQVRGSITPMTSVTMTSSAVNVTDLYIPPVSDPNATSVAASSFECLETSANRGWSSAARKPIYTKLAGTPFTFDVAALKSDGSLETSYVASGEQPKQVSIELVDGSGSAVCTDRNALNPASTQTLSFSSEDQGRKVIAGITLSKSYANLRCRVTDGTQSTQRVSCSSDNFSVRPGAVTLTTVPAMATPPSAQGLPRTQSGASFTLRAATTTAATDGYAGVLSQNPTKLTAQTPAQDSSPASGGAVGVLRPSSLIVNATPSNNASYDEVGYLYLGAGAFRDASFTAVDQVGDCVEDSTSVVAIGGKVGCNIGNDAVVALGRFHPDHFAVLPISVAAACVGGTPFTYFGEDGFTTAFTLTAQNLAGVTTKNYAGVFAKFNLTDYSSYGFNAGALPVGANLGSAAAPSGVWANGVASVRARHLVSRPTSPAAETAVIVSASPTDGETAAGPNAAVGAATSLRYGRLKMQNVYGSELMALPVPLEAQYWTGSFYVTNVADNCTTISASAITMGNYQKQLNACETQISPAGNVVLVNGKLPAPGWVLSKPGANNGGAVDLALTLGATAIGRTCVGPAESAATAANLPWFGLNPTARAIFGIYRSSIIYYRENY